MADPGTELGSTEAEAGPDVWTGEAHREADLKARRFEAAAAEYRSRYLDDLAAYNEEQARLREAQQEANAAARRAAQRTRAASRAEEQAKRQRLLETRRETIALDVGRAVLMSLPRWYPPLHALYVSACKQHRGAASSGERHLPPPGPVSSQPIPLEWIFGIDPAKWKAFVLRWLDFFAPHTLGADVAKPADVLKRMEAAGLSPRAGGVGTLAVVRRADIEAGKLHRTIGHAVAGRLPERPATNGFEMYNVRCLVIAAFMGALTEDEVLIRVDTGAQKCCARERLTELREALRLTRRLAARPRARARLAQSGAAAVKAGLVTLGLQDGLAYCLKGRYGRLAAPSAQ